MRSKFSKRSTVTVRSVNAKLREVTKMNWNRIEVPRVLYSIYTSTIRCICMSDQELAISLAYLIREGCRILRVTRGHV